MPTTDDPATGEYNCKSTQTFVQKPAIIRDLCPYEEKKTE